MCICTCTARVLFLRRISGGKHVGCNAHRSLTGVSLEHPGNTPRICRAEAAAFATSASKEHPFSIERAIGVATVGWLKKERACRTHVATYTLQWS